MVSIVCHQILQKKTLLWRMFILSDCDERSSPCALYMFVDRYNLCSLCFKHLFVYMYMCDVCVEMEGQCVHLWERCWQVGYVDVRRYACMKISLCVGGYTCACVPVCTCVCVSAYVCGCITSTFLAAPTQVIMQ